jgi:hypothetical protein
MRWLDDLVELSFPPPERLDRNMDLPLGASAASGARLEYPRPMVSTDES